MGKLSGTTTSPLSTLEKNIRRCATLTFVALMVTLFSLLWSHPLSFVMFVGMGLLLMLIAILFYLSSLVLGRTLWRKHPTLQLVPEK